MKTTFSLFILILLLNPFVFGQNNPPVAVNDTVYGFPGYPYRLNILANDYDPDGDSIYVKISGPSSMITRINDTTWEVKFSGGTGITTEYDSITTGYYLLVDSQGETCAGKVVFIYSYAPRFEYIDANNISALISPFGNHFWDLRNSHFEVPKGSGKTAVFNHTLWAGGLDQNNQLFFAGEKYRQVGKDYFQGPITSAVIDSSFSKLWNRVWKIDKEKIRYHINNWNKAGYTPIDAIASWPAHGDTSKGESYHIAPFYDKDGDGHYSPMQGDYPLIRGDQAVYFIYNDFAGIHTESEGARLGIEIHGMAYEFDRPDDSVLNNTLFFHLDILNKSAYDYHDTYISLFTDFDLGYANDDYVGTDVTHGMVYAYNGTEIDGNGEPEAYGEHPPAFGLCLLGGPFMNADGTDNPDSGCGYNTAQFNFGDGVADNERLGLCGSITFTNGGGYYCTEPAVAIEYYEYMKNIFTDGTHLNYGAAGHPQYGSVGPDCMYIYPGDSDTLCNWGTGGVLPNGGYNQNGYYWTEGTAGNDPNDRRMLAETGPFTFAAGQTQPLDYCFIFARDYQGNNLTSLDLLEQYSEILTSQAENLTLLPQTYYSVKEKYQSDRLKVIPNPVTDRVRIVSPESSASPFLISDINGQVRKSGNLVNGTAEVNLNDLKPGVYVVRSGGSNAKIIKL